jgi:hypothetical protein
MGREGGRYVRVTDGDTNCCVRKSIVLHPTKGDDDETKNYRAGLRDGNDLDLSEGVALFESRPKPLY